MTHSTPAPINGSRGAIGQAIIMVLLIVPATIGVCLWLITGEYGLIWLLAAAPLVVFSYLTLDALRFHIRVARRRAKGPTTA